MISGRTQTDNTLISDHTKTDNTQAHDHLKVEYLCVSCVCFSREQGSDYGVFIIRLALMSIPSGFVAQVN